MARQLITLRTAERMKREAAELEALSWRLKGEGHESEANGVRAISSQLGDIGRALERKLLEGGGA